jgi:hypothetical protein
MTNQEKWARYLELHDKRPRTEEESEEFMALRKEVWGSGVVAQTGHCTNIGKRSMNDKDIELFLAKRNVWRRKAENPPPGVTYMPLRGGILRLRVQRVESSNLEQLMTNILDAPLAWRAFKLAMEQHLAKKRP